MTRKYLALGKLLSWLIDFLSLFFFPVKISEITGARSLKSGDTISGHFVACPLTPRRMMNLPAPVVYRKIVQTGRLAQRMGADILGLGAFTSVVGDGGVTIASQLKIPVTTGDSYTVAVAMRAVQEAARKLRLNLNGSTLAVVGAAGAIGAVCAEMSAPLVQRLLLVGRNTPLDNVAERVRMAGNAQVEICREMNRLAEADIIITVTSDLEAIIEPHHLKSGAIVCDVARPRDISRQVARQRPDVLVIEGGMVAVPGPVDFGFDFGFPPKMAYACMAETMALVMEGRLDSYTLGKSITRSQVETIDKIAASHGFALGGFRSFERAVTEADITQVLLSAKPSPAPDG